MSKRVKPTPKPRPTITREGYVPVRNPKGGYKPPAGKRAPAKPPPNPPNKGSGGKK